MKFRFNTVFCNLCNAIVEPKDRCKHLSQHNLTWQEATAYGIFSYHYKEFQVGYSEDGTCPDCNDDPLPQTLHRVDISKSYYRELLKCRTCGTLYFCHFLRDEAVQNTINDYGDYNDAIVIDHGRVLASKTKVKRRKQSIINVTQLRESIEQEDMKDLKADISLKPKTDIPSFAGKVCASCDHSQFSRGSYICVLVDNYTDEIVVGGNKIACDKWLQKTEANRAKDVKALALFFSEKYEKEHTLEKQHPTFIMNGVV